MIEDPMTDLMSFIGDPKIFAAVLTACIGILTLLYKFIATISDSKREKKRELYERLIENVFRLLDAEVGAERSRVLTNIEMSWLFAPDDVLASCYEVLEAFEYASKTQNPTDSIRKDPDSKDMFEKAVSKLFVAMRNDLKFTKTNIDLSSSLINPFAYKYSSI